MKTRYLVITLALSTALAAGCAGSQWAKTGADATTVARDQDECREEALARGMPRGTPAMTSQGIGRSSGSLAGHPATSGNTRVIEEHEDVRHCMLRRGYRLERTN